MPRKFHPGVAVTAVGLGSGTAIGAALAVPEAAPVTDSDNFTLLTQFRHASCPHLADVRFDAIAHG